MRRCRLCLGFSLYRKLTATRVAFLLFLTGVMFFVSLQTSQQLTMSSAKIVDKKTVPVDINKVVNSPDEVQEGQAAEAKKAKEQATRVIGNGRSPKQVNEESQSKDSQKKDSQNKEKDDDEVSKLNHTKKSVGFPESPSPVDPLPSLTGPDSLQLLQDILMRVNKAQTIYNQEKFPPLDEDSLVLIVQVHKREGYLKQLLESLKVARGIEKVLLVISHDYYYDDMNKLIRSIDFCPVSMLWDVCAWYVEVLENPGFLPDIPGTEPNHHYYYSSQYVCVPLTVFMCMCVCPDLWEGG